MGEKPNPLPTATEALTLAWSIVNEPQFASEMNLRRAEVALGIAVELRSEAQFRATWQRYSPPIERDTTTALPIFGDNSDRVPAPVSPAVVTARIVHDPVSEPTQVLRVVWSIGDKADCRNCRTSIIFVTRRMTDPVSMGERSTQIWVHKYTDQRACAVPMLATDAEGAAHNYTFAEPSVDRG